MSLTSLITTSIIVTPRERFSCAPATLRTLLERTPGETEIVYVANGGGRQRCAELKALLDDKPSKFITGPETLPQNVARNLGARSADPLSKHFVFIDNDVIVEPDWLAPLVACAEAAGGAIVGPLIQEGDPAQRIVHMTGGIYREIDTPSGRVAFERHVNAHRPLASIVPVPRQRPADYVEAHCLLASRSVFEAIGGWDERLLTMCEYIDLCLRARAAGFPVRCEPRSVVTYGSLDGMTVEDVPVYLKRWDIADTRATFDRFIAMRGLRADSELVVHGENFVREHRGRLRIFDSGVEWARAAQEAPGVAPTGLQDFEAALQLRGYSISGCGAIGVLCGQLARYELNQSMPQAQWASVGLRAARTLLACDAHVSLVATALIYPFLRSGRIPVTQANDLIASAMGHMDLQDLGGLLQSVIDAGKRTSAGQAPAFAASPASALRTALVVGAMSGASAPAAFPKPSLDMLTLFGETGFRPLARLCGAT